MLICDVEMLEGDDTSSLMVSNHTAHSCSTWAQALLIAWSKLDMAQRAAALCMKSSRSTIQRLQRIILPGPGNLTMLIQGAYLSHEHRCKVPLPAAMHCVLLALIFWGSSALPPGLRCFLSLRLLSICIFPCCASFTCQMTSKGTTKQAGHAPVRD